MQKVLRFLAGIVGWTLLCLGLLLIAAICVILFIPFMIILITLSTSSIFINWSFGNSIKSYFE